MKAAKILVVDNDRAVVRQLTALLKAEGYQVAGAATTNEALNAIDSDRPDLMILDLRLVNDDPFDTLRDGYAVMHWLHNTLPGTRFPVIVHTADTSPQVETHSMACRVFAVFRKGQDLNLLLQAVREALQTRQASAAA